MNKIWLRLGDGGEYEPYSNLREVADRLEECRIEGISYFLRYGVTAAGFEGSNYISLFYGEDVTLPTGGISPETVAMINTYLRAGHSLTHLSVGKVPPL